ncbi:uncharacterized protein LOC115633728 [Scaptodrosophila lebanonensis]|uniref:Uncharacterized protein LOC115633728 n=1 Tax=Drosophila lebanonensis TaxID=7225 RepID=A0A6J2UF13_DROLE|nr:uncharacterized protein LOC115633728 [Scaptodrosophila lebanonensis]
MNIDQGEMDFYNDLSTVIHSPASTMYDDNEFNSAPEIRTHILGKKADGFTEMSYINTVTPPMTTPPLTPHPPQPTMPLISDLLSCNKDVESIVPPPGFCLSIPCFLCKLPFSDIESLKVHLQDHLEKSQEPADSTWIACKLCGRGVRSESELQLHHKRYHELHVSQNRAQNKSLRTEIQSQTQAQVPTQKQTKVHTKERSQDDRPFKCNICKKAYKVKGFLRNHKKTAHSDDLESQSSKESNTVLTTALWNAVAAAQYNPAYESVARYVPPDQPTSHKLDPCLLPPPKKKFAPRSPFFNRNLWLPIDACL